MAEQSKKSAQGTSQSTAGASTSKAKSPEVQTSPETSSIGDTASGSLDRSASSAGDGGAHGLVDQVKSSATDALNTAKSNTVTKLEEQKTALSSGLANVADNIRQLGQNIDTGKQADPLSRFAAEYSGTAAEKIESAANYFNTHDLNAMYSDVETLARRNPAIFVGGAFALGFLAARFFKSTSPNYNEYTGNGRDRGTTRSTAGMRSQPAM